MKLNPRSIALCAVLTALALGLSTLENLFPVTLIVPLPGVKLGLANIVTVFALYELGAVPALTILTARCLLGGVFAGNLSALLFSLLGGFTAMLVMIALKHCKGLSIYGVSIGAPPPTTSARWRQLSSHWAIPWYWAICPSCWLYRWSPVRSPALWPVCCSAPCVISTYLTEEVTLWTRKTRSFSSSWT